MNPDHEIQPLSPLGQQRKQDMLDALTGDMRQLHRRRKIQRRGAALCVAAITCTAAWWLWSLPSASTNHPSASPDNIIASDSSDTTVPPVRSSIIQTVRTHPEIASRMIVSSKAESPYLSDDALLDALAQIDRPTGLIRADSRVWLTNDVTDRSLR